MNKINIRIFIIAFLLVVLNACNTAQKENTKLLENEKPLSEMKTQYTHWFHIYYYKNYKKINILNPWKKGKIYHTYYLVNDSNYLRNNTDTSTYIMNNIEKVACLSADQIGAFIALGLQSKIAAVSQQKYIYNKNIFSAIKQGRIIEVGDYQTFNTERCLSANLDALFTTGWGQSQQNFQFLSKNNLPVIYYLAWQENNPLGRAEWIKFIAAFFDKEAEAKEYFSSIEKKYLQLTNDVKARITKKKSVFNGNIINGTWYVAGGESYLAQLLKDAQANYLFSDNKKAGSIPLNFEAVYLRAAKADFWLPSSTIENKDNRYQNFKAYQKHHIYIYNHRTNQSGANDYWESGSIHPEKILKDLITIFYPNLFPIDSLFYYQQIKF